MASLSERAERISPFFLQFSNGKLDNLQLQETLAYMAENSDSRQMHIRTINKVIANLNALRQQSATDNDLKSIRIIDLFLQKHEIEQMPTLFSWSDKQERSHWNDSLFRTFEVLNREISPSPTSTEGHYEHPLNIKNGNHDHVARYYLFDGYARWFTLHFGYCKDIQAEQRFSNFVVNALCEATVIGAEDGDIEFISLAIWMQKKGWFNSQWDFTPMMVERANAIVSKHSELAL